MPTMPTRQELSLEKEPPVELNKTLDVSGRSNDFDEDEEESYEVKQKSLQRQVAYDSREMIGFDDGWEADRTPPPRAQAGYHNSVGFAVLSSMTPGFLKSLGGTIGSERGRERSAGSRGSSSAQGLKKRSVLSMFSKK